MYSAQATDSIPRWEPEVEAEERHTGTFGQMIAEAMELVLSLQPSFYSPFSLHFLHHSPYCLSFLWICLWSSSLSSESRLLHLQINGTRAGDWWCHLSSFPFQF